MAIFNSYVKLPEGISKFHQCLTVIRQASERRRQQAPMEAELMQRLAHRYVAIGENVTLW